jgi:hypothetical protein
MGMKRLPISMPGVVMTLILLLTPACDPRAAGVDRQAAPTELVRAEPSEAEGMVVTELPAPVEESLSAAGPSAGPTPTPTPQGGGWTTFTNSVFAVTFHHPGDWGPDPAYNLPETGDTKYVGDDGFFIVGALEGADLDVVTTSAANHRLLPYGTAPTVERLTVQGQPARLIRPSDDQYPSMAGQAELIVTYPQPVTIGEYAYRYFSLAADRDHILSLAQTLRFTVMGEQPAAPPTVEPPHEPTLEAQQPEIITFTVSPDDRLDFGDMATVRWSVTGAMQSLFCYRYGVRLTAEPGHDLLEQGGECFGGVPAECHLKGADGDYLYSQEDEKCAGFLPAEGLQEVVLAPLEEGEAYYVTFWLDALSGTPDPQERYGLRAPIYEDSASVTVPVTCLHEWFMPNRPRWCPADPPWSSAVTAQTFEDGVMLYLPADGPAPDAVHAFYRDGGKIRQTTLFAVSPEHPDPGLVPPAGLKVPEEIFYPVWNGAMVRTPLREVMGWATGEPFSFIWVGQYEQGPDSWDAQYVNMPDGTILRFDHVESAWTVWD